MSTAYFQTDASFLRVESTGCESVFESNTSVPDALGNLTRYAVLIQGAAFPGLAEFEPGQFVAMIDAEQ